MKTRFIIVFLALAPVFSFAAADSVLFSSKEPTHIEVNNRILANVNGKAISVYDLMKKMDVTFYKQYPQYASAVEARYQFYKMSWKTTLHELIDKELIMLDAKEIGLPVSAGDIRQDMETIFGPNIHANLDNLGMTFEEAESILKDEIIIRRMLQARVGMKASNNVTPIVIKQAYETYAKNNLIPPEFIYKVITIRDPNEKNGLNAAQEALRLLREERIPLEILEQSITTSGVMSPKGKVSVSDEMRHADKDISESYREALAHIYPGDYSDPQVQISKQDKSKVFRIFYLKERKLGGQVPFKEVENKIKEELLSASYHKETDDYLQKMREHFHINIQEIEQTIPVNFDPFVMK